MPRNAGHSSQLYSELWDVGKDIGMTPFGNYALNSLRIEPGFMVKADLDYSHYTEAGLWDCHLSTREVHVCCRNRTLYQQEERFHWQG